jgi:hypothetical protein
VVVLPASICAAIPIFLVYFKSLAMVKNSRRCY